MAEPLRIGILGAARIAGDGIVDPARALGHRLVAVAARDRPRAEEFATEYGVERVVDDYATLITDPEVDVVYDALINSAHAEWNTAALQAGKHVLSEKPITANAAEAHALATVAATSTGRIVEGFHYLHHPVVQRLREIVTGGELGELREVMITLQIPAPPDTDPRWSVALAGGATMDLGCYVLNAARHLGHWIGSAPRLVGASAEDHAPGVDARMSVLVEYAGGLPGRLSWDMAAEERSMVWTVVGTAGTATLPAFAVPHLDNRILLALPTGVREETHGDQTSYTYQLAALAAALRTDGPFLVDVADAVANMELVDGCYRAAGREPRGS